MTHISRMFILISFVTFGVIACEFFYVQSTRTLRQQTLEKKALFTSLVGLTDLSLVTEARYVRHRSLSDVFSLFGDGPELREYFPSTFVYQYSPLFKKAPTQIAP